MTSRLEYDAFAANINTTFGIQLENADAVEAELTQISDHLLSPRQERFAIVFRVSNDTLLGQGMRRLQHEKMGEFELFLVPISKDENGTYYEAVFNRFRKEE